MIYMHRGHNRQAIFQSDEDMIRIKEDIQYALKKSGCALHAYVVMSNHLHLLITPDSKAHLATFMKVMAAKYVRYFNAKYKRTGTMWEGRFKSCLVDSEAYLFTLYKYIEMNPIKANMVASLNDYQWSSYAHHALGQEDVLIAEHDLYQALGGNVEARCEAYKAIFGGLDMTKQRANITQATERGEVLGVRHFISVLQSSYRGQLSYQPMVVIEKVRRY